VADVDFQEVVRRRRMVRSFADRPLEEGVLDRILANARRGPSAGFSQGLALVVLEGPEETAVFWGHATDEEWRDQPDWPGLLRAPVIILPLAHKQTYLDRYAEPDKAGAGLQDEAAWPVPFWTVDTAFTAMLILLSAVDAGLGALFFALRRDRYAGLLEALAVPAGYDPIGVIALGHASDDDRPSGSAVTRARRPLGEIVHRGRW
jgi:nitroreductase